MLMLPPLTLQYCCQKTNTQSCTHKMDLLVSELALMSVCKQKKGEEGAAITV